MNPKNYAEKAITIEPLSFHTDISIDVAADVVLRSGYPEPKTGVTIYSGERGLANGGIDWGAKHLRLGIAELIEKVAEDCLSVIKKTDDIDDGVYSKIESAIHQHFEIRIH